MLTTLFHFLTGLGLAYGKSELEKRSIKNSNEWALISFACAIICILFVNISLPNPYKWLNTIGALCYLLTIFFNYLGWIQLAKINIWLVSSLVFFWLASAFGYESNCHLLFVVILFATLFNYQSKKDLQIACIIIFIPFLLLGILFATDFSLFTIEGLTLAEKKRIGIFNFFSSIMGCLIIIGFYLRENSVKTDVIKDSEREIRVQYEELQKANKELDLLVYSVTHDLRAPITSAIALVDICRNNKQQIDYYLGLQEKSLLKLDSFITDILYYYRNSRLEVKAQAIDFYSLIENIYTFQNPQKDAITIEKTLEVNNEIPFYGDELRLTIVFNNLISNAIRYADLSSGNPYVHTKIQIEKEKVIIQVIDNGIGIPEAHLPKIFNMFYRANKDSQGSGLGLYIVKEAMNKLNGTLQVSSQVGFGTTFTLVLPNLTPRNNSRKQVALQKEILSNIP